MKNKDVIIICLVIIFVVLIFSTAFILNSSHSNDYNVTIEGKIFSIPGDYVAGPLTEKTGTGYHMYNINCTKSNGDIIGIDVGKGTFQHSESYWRNYWRDAAISEGFAFTTINGYEGYIHFYNDGICFWYVDGNSCIEIFADNEEAISNIIKYW